MTRRRRAAALRYDRGRDGAPRVVATGEGLMAERLTALARDHGVPIHEDPELAAALSRLPIDQEIPPELFAAVAEIIGFIYRLNGVRLDS